MARLPVIIAQGGTAAPRFNEQDWGGTQRLARQAGGLADRAFDIAERQAELRRTVELATSAADITRQLDDYRVELDGDPDFGTKAQRFQQRARQLMDERTSGMNETTRAAFLARVEPMAASMESAVRHSARRDEIDDAKVKLVNTNDDLLNRASMARNNVERDGYLSQVQANIDDAMKARILSAAQHKELSRASISKFQEARAMGLVRTNPAGAIAALGDPEQFAGMDPVRREFYKSQATAKLEARGAEARANARFEAADISQSLSQGVLPEDFDARLKVVEAGNPLLARRLREQKGALDTIDSVRKLPLDEQKARIGVLAAKEDGPGLNRTERIEYLALSKLYQHAAAGFAEDAFLQSVKSNPTVGILLDQVKDDPKMRLFAAEAAIDTQAKNGVPEAQRAVMSKPEIKAIVAELQGLSGPAFDERLRQLRTQWGHLWPVAARQLREQGKVDGKLPGFETILELPDTPAGRSAAANLADAAKLKDDDLRKLVPKDADLTAIRSKVEENLADFRVSAASQGGAPTVARYVEDATKRAVILQASGMSANDAAERAARELVNDHYSFIAGDNGAIVRVPKLLDQRAVDLDAIRSNLAAAKRQLPDVELTVPPNPMPGADAGKDKASFARRLQAYGQWQTTGDGRGAMLVYEASGRLQPVLVKGKPYVVAFNAPRLKAPEDTRVFDPLNGILLSP